MEFCGVICGRAVAETRGQGSHLGIRAFHIRFRWLICSRCVAGRTSEALQIGYLVCIQWNRSSKEWVGRVLNLAPIYNESNLIGC